jgi:cob(I)alamin adenosyltransferase
MACQEARTIVDLTTPVDSGSTMPDTIVLSEVTRRIHHLDRRLQELAGENLPARTLESIEDVRRVASSLAAALDAERSLRLGNHETAAAHRARSAQRIAERSYELNAAVEELQWLVEVED